jgi:hypothetical protein
MEMTLNDSTQWRFPYREDLRHILDRNAVPLEKCCLIKSLALDAMGLRAANDLDFCVEKPFFDAMAFDDTWKPVDESPEYTVVSCGTVDLDVGYYEALLGISDAEIINNPRYHFIHDGFKVIRPELVFATKAIRQRPHDLRDLDMLTEYAKKYPENWDWELVSDPVKGLPAPRLDWCFQEKERLWAASSVMLPPAMLFSLQYRGNEFNAVDAVVRYGAIDDYLHGRDEAVALYKKMQWLRGKYKTWDTFVKLIENFKEKRFDHEFPIETDTYGTLFDGSHRLACSLYFDLPLIPVLCVKEHFDRDYRYEWFERIGFTSEELERVRQWQHTIFSRKGMYFNVTLWPPAADHFDDIERDIAAEYAVMGRREIVCDDAAFAKLSRAVCETDDIAEWKLLRKQHYLYRGENRVRFLEIHVPAPTWRKKAQGKSLCVEMEAFKKKLRAKHRQCTEKYVQDILIHISDNPIQSRAIKELGK